MKHIILPLFKQLLPIIFLGQFLHGCFLMPEEESVSSSTCTTDCSSPASSTGVFVDSAVAGVTYTTSSGLSGTTNASGEFSYQPGDTASFSIGDVSLGSVTASAVLTPVEVMGASDTADRKVINLARLLQTLDSDGDASNGIEITSSTRNSLSSKTLNFDVDVDTFTNDGTVSQIQTAVGRTLVSATSALNHLHSTMNERSLNSKVSSDSKLRAMGGTLGSFTFTSTKTLVGAAQNHLQGKLERLGTLSKDEIKTIIDAGKAQLTSDNLSKSESPQSVLPSFLKGAMKGIGQAKLGSDNLTKQAISNTTSGVMSLIGRFQDKLTSTSRTPARSANEKTAFENLLGLLMDTAVGSLAGTGLSKEALDDGLGEVVGAMVSSLDEAKTDAAEMTAAVQTITKKAVQKAASIPGMDASNAIKSITKNAVRGLGKTKMNPAQVTATLSKAVETVVDTLDEVEGASNLNLSAVVADVTTSSVEGLADLQQSFANDTSFDVSKAVNNIAGGATKGAGILAAAPNSALNLTETIGSLSQSTASAVGKLTTDSNMVTALTQGIQSEINTSVDTISKDNPNLKIDPVTIKQKAQEKLQQGIAAIPKSCNFDGKKISGYGDPSSQVLAYFSKTVGFGQTCTSQTRTCDKGELSGSYPHSSCVIQAPANCTLERQTVAHDKKIKAWEEKEVPFGNACKSQERTCFNGTLSGSYSHLSCIVRAPATAPTIVSTHPAQNANNIAVPDNITINFSTEINPRSVMDQIVVSDRDREVMGETDTQGKVVIFKPRSAFSPGTSYSVTVKTGITDTAGTALASESTWNFTTAPATAPTIVSTHPAQNANNIAVPDNITINFSAEIEGRSVMDQIVVSDGSREVSGSTDTHGKVVSFTPREAFSPDTSYSVTVKTGITDTAGTALASESTWNFTTAPATAPTIVSTHPAKNANNIAVPDNITITFSAEIDGRSVSQDQIVVSDGSREVSGYTDAHGKVVSFTPREAFSQGTNYSVTLKPGIKDKAGTALASESTWNFNTAPATAPAR